MMQWYVCEILMYVRAAGEYANASFMYYAKYDQDL